MFGDIDPLRLELSTWYWQFRDNPAGKAFCCIAEENGVIVGQYAAIPTRFCVHGQETVFAFSCDTMTHPDYRKQGMFVALAEGLYRSIESHEGISTVWGFPNEISLPGFTRRLGWDIISVFALRLMPIRPFTMLHRHIPFPGRQRSGTPVSGLKPASIPGPVKIRDILIEPVHHFNEVFNSLWNNNKDLYPVIQVRDSAYLNWRYMEIPGFHYQVFSIKWKGRQAGYIVLRFMNLMGHYFAALVDLFPFPIKDRHITGLIFSFARDHCKEQGAEFLTCLLPRADTEFLKKAGFKKIPAILNPKKWHFGCLCNDRDRALLHSKENWFITYGDTDIV